MSYKGRRIRFITGPYAGYKGWLDTEEGETAETYRVVVDGYKGKRKNEKPKEKRTWVKKTSVRMEKAINTYEEAALDQHPDIDILMEKLVKELAKFDLDRENTGFVSIFEKKLGEAIVTQDSLGHKARWRRVDFEKEKDNNKRVYVDPNRMTT